MNVRMACGVTGMGRLPRRVGIEAVVGLTAVASLGVGESCRLVVLVA